MTDKANSTTNNDTCADAITQAGAELHADRLHELRCEMELRFSGEFAHNAVNRLDAASNFLRLYARTTSQPVQLDERIVHVSGSKPISSETVHHLNAIADAACRTLQVGISPEAQDGLVDALRVIAVGEACMNGVREELSADTLRKIARNALALIELKPDPKQAEDDAVDQQRRDAELEAQRTMTDATFDDGECA